ncbi:UrcA family protein [Sphingomonas sp. MMS12-HWE2-04]|uniref:UrcA family protein n=1 Tax=Sphingomonas sp. MMS12-HWE2-04 TaxID=3234199 RepID=UPI0038517B62
MINALIAATLLSAGATPAFQTASPDAAPIARVQVRDLDLAHESGRHTLDRRIARAIDTLCPATPPTGQIVRSLASQRCRFEAKAQFDQHRARLLARASAPQLAAGSR